MKLNLLYLIIIQSVLFFINIECYTLSKSCDKFKGDESIAQYYVYYHGDPATWDDHPTPCCYDWFLSVQYGELNNGGGWSSESFYGENFEKSYDYDNPPQVFIIECHKIKKNIATGYNPTDIVDVELNNYCYKTVVHNENKIKIVQKKNSIDEECIDGFTEYVPGDDNQNNDTPGENENNQNNDTPGENENNTSDNTEEPNNESDIKIPQESDNESESESDNESDSEEQSNATTNSSSSGSSHHPWQCGKGIGKCKDGYCCSKYGWCGKTNAYCSKKKGCQSELGRCKDEKDIINESDNEESSTEETYVPGQCGEGIGKCKDGYCCSKYGWCGDRSEYCSKINGCQSEFGYCW